MRIALFTRLPPLLTRIAPVIAGLGHEVVGVVTTEGPPGRYGHVPLSSLIDARPDGVDILVADNARRFASLLAALEPDLAVCGGFPVRIPADAIAVPRLGVLNGHPSPLPRYRGPNPIGWALRNGDTELGFTFHFMDARDRHRPDPCSRAPRRSRTQSGAADVIGALFGLWTSLLPEALARVEAGEPGEPAERGRRELRGLLRAGVRRARPDASAEEVHRQVRAWAVAARRGRRPRSR